MTTFAPIHNHSQYSALDGLSTPLEIAQRCQCIGCTSAGITDHGTVAGHLEFSKVMRAHDIKPIFGVEFYHGVKASFEKNERDQFHFVAGAMTDEGLRNIWRMVDAASDPDNYRYVGRINWDICKRFNEGVFATSACIQGLVARWALAEVSGDGVPPYLNGVLDRYLEVYRDNFYIELHTYPGEEHELLNWTLVGIAQERGIPLIYATDAHFASPDQYEVHDAYVAMQTGESVLMDPAERKMWHPKSLYIQDLAQIRASLSYLPDSVVAEALANSAELAERCNADLPEVKRHIPIFVPGESPWQRAKTKETAAIMLLRLVEDGIHWRYGEPGPEVWDKAAYEIEVMLDAGLEHYFLQVWDLCQFCDREGISRGPGRGSAAGSIISYTLGITDVDPIRFGLIFERFWNPGRAKGFPDIDIDFPVKHRKRVREYLMKRWGNDKVRTIGTTMRMKPKATLDKTYKVCGVTWDEKEELKKIIGAVPDIDIHGADTIGWDENADPGKTIYVMHSTDEVKHNVGQHVVEWVGAQPDSRHDTLLRWLEIVEVVCGRPSGYGVHPSGVVVSDVPLADELPCMYNRSQEVQVTCFAMADVDKLGFLKDDLLGLRNLDTLETWEELLDERQDWHERTYEQMPDEMWELLDVGLTLGIFQIEKGYARQLCKNMRPRSIEDLALIVALNRPGPIRAGTPESLIRRKRGDEAVSYDHPILEPILEGTWGHFVYQEQIMRFFSALGYSESDADEVRKILGKKKPEVMATVRYGDEEWAGKGYTAMALAAGLDQASIDLIWSKIEGFASYSFNLAHATCYGVMAFRTLYAKWRDGPKFTIACIQTNPDDAGDYVSEGRRRGIPVNPPHIRKSEWDIKDVEGDIYFGFSNIKGIGKGAAQYVVKLREDWDVHTLEEFDAALDHAQELWDGARTTKRSPKQVFGANKITLLRDTGVFDQYQARELDLSEVQRQERDLLGVILTDNAVEILMANSERIDECDTYYDLETCATVSRLDIPGIVASVTPKRTKRDGKAMGIVTIEYDGDEAEFVVFPREWAQFRPLFCERTVAIFSLSKTKRGWCFQRGLQLS